MTGFFTSGLLFGCLLILIGLITLINIIFQVHIPIFRILFALLFMYCGIKILWGANVTRHYYYSSCSSTQNRCSEKNVLQYNTLFSKQIIDLTNQDILKTNTLIEVDTAFGESIVLIDTIWPLKIDTSVAFGSIELPNNMHANFGKDSYQTSTYENTTDAIHIRAKVAFGKCSIIDKKHYHRSMNEGKDNHEQKV